MVTSASVGPRRFCAPPSRRPRSRSTRRTSRWCRRRRSRSTDESTAKRVLRLIELLEEHDDVQNVWSNFDIPDDILERSRSEPVSVDGRSRRSGPSTAAERSPRYASNTVCARDRPGLSRCGYGCVDRTRSGTNGPSPPASSRPRRRCRCRTRLATLRARAARARRASSGPTSSSSSGSSSRRTRARRCRSARRAASRCLTAAELGCEVVEYSSNEVKLAVAGYGAATKIRCRGWWRGCWISGRCRAPRRADALALALCHLARPRGRGRHGHRLPRGAAQAAPWHGRDRFASRHRHRTAPARRRFVDLVVDVGGVGYRLLVAPAAAGLRPRPRGQPSQSTPTSGRARSRSTASPRARSAPLRAAARGPRRRSGSRPGDPQRPRPVELAEVIATGNVDALRLVPGVGKKTAERLLLELQARFDYLSVDGVAVAGVPRSNRPPSIAAEVGEALDTARATGRTR